METHLDIPPVSTHVHADHPVAGYREWELVEALEPGHDYDWVHGIEAVCNRGGWILMTGRKLRWESYAEACRKAGVQPEPFSGNGHLAPRASCTCGVEALLSPDSLPSQPSLPVLIGIVVGWGRVVVEEGTWRAQFARVLALFNGAEDDTEELRRIASRDSLPLLGQGDQVHQAIAKAGRIHLPRATRICTVAPTSGDSAWQTGTDCGPRSRRRSARRDGTCCRGASTQTLAARIRSRSPEIIC